jgi:hypothetical protein
MSNAYQPHSANPQSGPLDSDQDKIENGLNIEDVQAAYVQLKDR